MPAKKRSAKNQNQNLDQLLTNSLFTLRNLKVLNYLPRNLLEVLPKNPLPNL